MHRFRLALISTMLTCVTYAPTHADVYSEIRSEALKTNNDAGGRPLPLASHWTNGVHPWSEGWAPTWQMSQIAAGRHLLPWFQLPDAITGVTYGYGMLNWETYARASIEEVCARGLPLVLSSTQWEYVLTQEPYRSLAAAQNPNVVLSGGAVQQPVTISPFGPVSAWETAGQSWTNNSLVQQLQQWCPNPTRVIFLSNNEATKLDWAQAESDYRYVAQYGTGQADQTKRQIVGDAWIPRYRALQAGMRTGLTSATWRANARFIAYNATGPMHYSRWGGWPAYSLQRTDLIDPSPLIWDGGSGVYYLMNSTPTTDYLSWSPQNEFQNLVFMQKEALAINPDFWFEMSVWDGYTPGGDALKNSGSSDNRAYFASLGQTYTPDRYKGFVQFGMWLNRPRAVREFRGWTQYRDVNTEPYFMAVVDAVDSVHRNTTLKSFWRTGRLLSVSNYQHPYQSNVAPEYAGKPRWFILEADANGFSPPGISSSYPANVTTEIKVFSLALEKGSAPSRTWLVYANSPLQSRSNVRVTIPGYGTVVTLPTVSVAGNFYKVSESTGQVSAILP